MISRMFVTLGHPEGMVGRLHSSNHRDVADVVTDYLCMRSVRMRPIYVRPICSRLICMRPICVRLICMRPICCEPCLYETCLYATCMKERYIAVIGNRNTYDVQLNERYITGIKDTSVVASDSFLLRSSTLTLRRCTTFAL